MAKTPKKPNFKVTATGAEEVDPRQEKLRAVQARVQQRRAGGRAPVADASRKPEPATRPGQQGQAPAQRRPVPTVNHGQGAKPQSRATPAKADARPPKPQAGGEASGVAAGLRDLLGRVAQLTEAGLRAPNVREASALLVNRIAEIVATDRVVLVELGLRPKLINVSGGGIIEQDSRFSEAVSLLNRRLRDQADGVIVPDEPDEGGDRHLRDCQMAMRGTQILWLPLPFEASAGADQIRYALWLERWRGRAWLADEVKFLNRASVFFGQMLRPRGGRVREKLSRKKVLAVVLGVLIGAMLIPVESSSIAPARVVPANPTYVFAPLEGVLKELEVKPGQQVSEGDILFRYDPRLLDKKLDEALREVAVARVELERIEGAAFRDSEARSKLPVQKLEVELAEENLAFLREQRELADVRATSSGIIVLDDPDALIGRPLQLGEQVFGIADPGDTKIRMMVPSSDAGLLRDGQRVELRLDRDPLNSIAATVTRIGFDIVMSDENIASVLTEARWDDDVPGGVQPGQRGSAKLISDPRPLWKQIFRKPLIKLREITGV